MSGHTPGPWVVDPEPCKHYWQIYDGKFKKIGTSPCGGSKNTPEQIATYLDNARLIAAAPDLLAVVKELEESAAYWSEYDVPIGIVDRLRAAIAKATGEAA